MAWWRHLRAWVILPFNVLFIIPAWLLWQEGSIRWFWHTTGVVKFLLVALAIGFFFLGTTLMAGSIRLLAKVGQGTLAPWDPTKVLVVTGVYRYVRNPMMSGVFSILIAECLTFGQNDLVIWFLVFVLGNIIFVPWFEERRLLARFGESYREFCRHVPRWIPRTTPWQPPPHSDPPQPQKDLAPKPGLQD